MAGTLTPTPQTTTSLLADSAASIDAHLADLANPHAVTATQVGLGSVDNTTDLNKPVSTATQTALDVKVSKTSTTGSAVLPSGTTAEGGTGAVGYIRHDSTLDAITAWIGGAWATIATTANAVLLTGAQSIAGIKTFLDGIEITATKAIDFLGTSGLLKVGGTTVVTLRTDGMAIPAATASGDALQLEQNINLQTAQASTSGTSKDFTGIPSWAKRVTMLISGVSLSGTDNFYVRVGNTSFVATGYLGSTTSQATTPAISAIVSNVGFGIIGGGANVIIHGSVVLSLVDSATNTWSASLNIVRSDASITQVGAGTIALSSALDRVQILSSGTNTFDAGLVNVSWE